MIGDSGSTIGVPMRQGYDHSSGALQSSVPGARSGFRFRGCTAHSLQDRSRPSLFAFSEGFQHDYTLVDVAERVSLLFKVVGVAYGRRNRFAVFQDENSKNPALFSRPSVSSQKSVPKEVDHRKVAVPAAMVDEVQFLFVPEPVKSAKA